MYTFDACANGIGRLCSVSDKTGTTTWAYDIRGRVVAKTRGVGTASQTVAYNYNAAGQLESLVTPSGQVVQYAYANGRPVSVSVNGTVVLDQVFYEPFGPNGGWRWGNATSLLPNFHSRLHDADFRVEKIASDLPVAAGSRAIDKSYSWDPASRIMSISDIANAALSATYDYDDLDRLTVAGMGASSWGYAYNGIGDRVTSTVGAASTTYTYFPGTHRLQSLGGAQARSFVFDNAGNMTSDGAATWAYGGNNRPTQVQAGAVTTSFDINALGQRVRKTTGAAVTRFVHDEAGRLLGEYDGDGALRAEYIWLDDLPVAVISAQTRQAGVNDDLDGDAVPDLVFRHAQSGDTYAWLLRRDYSVASAPYLGQVDPVWDLVGTADFNADGNLDIVWRHSVNGAAYVWFYAGTQYIGNSYLFTSDPAWKVASIADFNGDGKPDVILRDRASGTAWAHYFDGTQYLGGDYAFTLDPAWRLAGTADIDRDGKRDFVWTHATTGDAVAWYMNGIQYLAYEYMATVPAGWGVVRVADFDGDFNADLVIRDAVVGAASVESFRGADWVSSTGLYNVDPAWQQAPAGEAVQKATTERASPPVNRPLPAGFVRPSVARRAGARTPEFARMPNPASSVFRTARDGPPPPGPKPPEGKSMAKTADAPFAIYYVTPDHLGTPRVITRPVDNKIVWRWDNTEPFGNSPANENPSGIGAFAFNLRFPGQYFDQETGTHYNYFRDYDPVVGRYVQSDPIGLDGGLNTYGYVGANPVRAIDALGLANGGWDQGRGRRRPPKPGTSEPNGNQRPGYTEQDWICSLGGWFSNDFGCWRQCCFEHDACFEKNRCNQSSWGGPLGSACQQCNLKFVACMATGSPSSPCQRGCESSFLGAP